MALSHILGCVLALALTTAAAEVGRSATVYLTNEDNSIKGTVNFTQEGSGQEVKVIGSISGLPVGEHGFHIHEKGDVTNKCVAAGAHFNPHHKVHGAPNDTERHVGDLGNINTTNSDTTIVNISDKVISLYGAHSIIGRAVVVHQNRDDLGRGDSPLSNSTGDAGSRIACGVIGIQTPIEPWNTGAANSLTQSLTTAVMSVLLVTLLKELVM